MGQIYPYSAPLIHFLGRENVRKAPTMKFEIIAKIHPGDLIYADAYECRFTDDCGIDNWTHIGSVLRSSGDGRPQALRGWVGSRFLKFIRLERCEKNPSKCGLKAAAGAVIAE